MKQVVLVNGVPASGKSTVARLVSARFGWPLLSLDTIKEPFFEQLGVGDREFNRKLGRASYRAIFDLVAEFPDDSTTVVDAWFNFQPLGVLTAHLERSGITRSVEIWCHAPADVITARYETRVGRRSVGHPGIDYLPELKKLAVSARPLAIHPRLDIDTAVPIDEDSLFVWLEAAGLGT